jgi:hypothetical protein
MQSLADMLNRVLKFAKSGNPVADIGAMLAELVDEAAAQPGPHAGIRFATPTASTEVDVLRTLRSCPDAAARTRRVGVRLALCRRVRQ